MALFFGLVLGSITFVDRALFDPTVKASFAHLHHIYDEYFKFTTDVSDYMLVGKL